MVIVSEKNYLKGNNFKVLRSEKFVDDEKYREEENQKRILLGILKRKRIKKLELDIKKQMDFINSRQIEMLKEENISLSKVIERHIFEVLIPELHSLQRELKALKGSK